MSKLSIPEFIKFPRVLREESALRKIGSLVAGFPVETKNPNDVSSAVFISDTRCRFFVAQVTDYPRDASRQVRIHAERARSNHGPESFSNIEIDVTWNDIYGPEFPPEYVVARRSVARSMQPDQPATTYDSLRPAAENTFSALDVARVLSLVPVHSSASMTEASVQAA